jgi:hypothetical protein
MLTAQRDPLLHNRPSLWRMWEYISTAAHKSTSLTLSKTEEFICPTTFARLLQHAGFSTTLWVADANSDPTQEWARLRYTITSRRIVCHQGAISPPLAGAVWPKMMFQYHIICNGDHYFNSSQVHAHSLAQHEIARVIRSLLRKPNGTKMGIPLLKGPLTWWIFRIPSNANCGECSPCIPTRVGRAPYKWNNGPC